MKTAYKLLPLLHLSDQITPFYPNMRPVTRLPLKGNPLVHPPIVFYSIDVIPLVDCEFAV